MLDWWEHPDLREVGQQLQERFDTVLEAEQRAAAVMLRRSATLRDRLLDIEDAGGAVAITAADGSRYRGGSRPPPSTMSSSTTTRDRC